MGVPRLHVAGNRTYLLETDRSFAAFDPGWDGPGGPTLPAVASLVRHTGKPLRYLFLSHHHHDHAANLPLYEALHRSDPASFPFLLVAHPSARIDHPRRHPTDLHPVIDLDGVRLECLATSGHTSRLDDLSLWLPGPGLLFPGDLVQPQGPAYETCDYHTPVSNHARPDLAIVSLERLAALPFSLLLMGHDGVILDRAAGLSAIAVTLETLRRTRDLVESLALAEAADEEALMERVFDTVARERGLAPEAVEARKITGHAGRVARLGADSFYRLYDLPSIRWFVKNRRLPG